MAEENSTPKKKSDLSWLFRDQKPLKIGSDPVWLRKIKEKKKFAKKLRDNPTEIGTAVGSCSKTVF